MVQYNLDCVKNAVIYQSTNWSTYCVISKLLQVGTVGTFRVWSFSLLTM